MMNFGITLFLSTAQKEDNLSTVAVIFIVGLLVLSYAFNMYQKWKDKKVNSDNLISIIFSIVSEEEVKKIVDILFEKANIDIEITDETKVIEVKNYILGKIEEALEKELVSKGIPQELADILTADSIFSVLNALLKKVNIDIENIIEDIILKSEEPVVEEVDSYMKEQIIAINPDFFKMDLLAAILRPYQYHLGKDLLTIETVEDFMDKIFTKYPDFTFEEFIKILNDYENEREEWDNFVEEVNKEADEKLEEDMNSLEEEL